MEPEPGGGSSVSLSTAPMDRLLRAGGAERIGNETPEALAEILERYGECVARRAARYAEHAGRKTVTAEDVELAVDSLK